MCGQTELTWLSESKKKTSLTGHSHTHRPNTWQKIKKHTRATSRHPSAQCVIWICCWPRTASRCVTSVFPLFLCADHKGSMLTQNPSSRGHLAGKPSFEDQFCHASTSPTRLGMRRTGEPPTCSQCCARGSNTGKNTPSSFEACPDRNTTVLFPLVKKSWN